MIEKTDNAVKNLKIGAVVLGALSLGTFSAAFTLVCLDQIKLSHFAMGVGIGASIMVGGLSTFSQSIRQRFFRPSIPEEEQAYIFQQYNSGNNNGL